MRHLPRVIVCAAIQLKDGRVVCGVRHFDQLMIVQLHSMGFTPNNPPSCDQGFVDNDYRYLDRNEAWKVAEAAGQIHREHGSIIEGCLHSEDLY